MKVEKLFIYPIKGLRAVPVDSINVGKTGFEHDRNYMLADSKDGSLICQRNSDLLTQMLLSREGNSWKVSCNNDSLVIKDNTISSYQLEVEVWDARFVCNEVSVEHSIWFSKQLQKDVKLVVMPNIDTRIKEIKKAPYTTPLKFVDGYPILSLGTKSVEYLNSKLTDKIDESRFRPNIFIKTNVPHEEDKWSDFMIGSDCLFRNIKPCVRCQVIMIDQVTGAVGKEPLQTLSTYRKFDNDVCFGSYSIVLKGGEIKVGDEIKLGVNNH